MPEPGAMSFRFSISRETLIIEEILSESIYSFALPFFVDFDHGYDPVGVTLTKGTPNPQFKTDKIEFDNNLQTFGLIGTKIVSGDDSVATAILKDTKVEIVSVGIGTTDMMVQDNAGHEASIHIQVLSTGSFRYNRQMCVRPITLTVEYNIVPKGGYKGGSGSFVSHFFGSHSAVGLQFAITPIGDWDWDFLIDEMIADGCDIPKASDHNPEIMREWNFSIDPVENGPAIWNFANGFWGFGSFFANKIITDENVTMKIEG
jgi:hypothetical protein